MLTYCSSPGCGNLTKREKCPICRKRAEARRGTPAARGYNAAWRRIRIAFLAAHPYCVTDGCNGIATEVDHIRPLSQGGTNDWSNLRAMCKRCHSRRTAKDQSRLGKR